MIKRTAALNCFICMALALSMGWFAGTAIGEGKILYVFFALISAIAWVLNLLCELPK